MAEGVAQGKVTGAMRRVEARSGYGKEGDVIVKVFQYTYELRDPQLLRPPFNRQYERSSTTGWGILRQWRTDCSVGLSAVLRPVFNFTLLPIQMNTQVPRSIPYTRPRLLPVRLSLAYQTIGMRGRKGQLNTANQKNSRYLTKLSPAVLRLHSTPFPHIYVLLLHHDLRRRSLLPRHISRLFGYAPHCPISFLRSQRPG